MADKRISQLVERVTLLNNDVFPIVASGATTTNKVTLQTIDDYLQTNLDFGVTSVAMTVPTGLSVTGTPITSTGTFVVTFTAGYSIPTNAKQTQWDTAYSNRIVSVTAPITFASNVLGITQSGAASDGYLSSTDWNTFNNKQAALTFGNLTEATSSVLTITGGTGAVIGAGTSIEVKQASGSQDGFLDSADWTTFNNKQNALSGTGIVKSTGGTITYLTDNTSNWDSAYNDKINSASVTGTTTKTLTLTQQDGGTITTTWTDLDTGTVTSVGVSMPSAFSVANSPITSSGTIAITGAGTTAQYIDGTGALQTFPNIISQATNLVTEVYNNSGATLSKGTVVYITGGQGNLPTISKALATGDSTSAQTYGVVQTDITNMNNGYVVVAGRLIDLDTQAYANGTQLYLSSTTAGAWTSTKQYAPDHLVYVGIVVRSHPTQGVVEIKIQNGYEMDELHDVSAQNPNNNDILQYKTATGLWTKTAGTTTNIAEGTNLYYTDDRARAAFSESVTGLDYNSSTGVLSTTTGYAIPTTASQTNWDAAYNDKINSAAVTGTTTKTLTLNQQDGGTITASWTDINTDAVTSVFGRTGAVVATEGDYTLTQLGDVTITTPTNGQFLKYDGTSWINAAAGTVTSVALATGTTGTDVGVTGSPITGAGTITLNIPVASATNTGKLSSTDWSTFNGKQAALNGTGFVKISGTTISYDNNSYVDTTNPQYISGYKTFYDGISVQPTGALTNVINFTASMNPTNANPVGANFGFSWIANANNQTFSGVYISAASPSNPSGYTGLTTYALQTSGNVKIGGTLQATGNITGANLSGTNTGDQTLAGLGGVPTSRTLTINGTAYDLSADRSWTIAAGVTSFNTRTGAITLTKGDVQNAVTSAAGDPPTDANTFYYGVLYNYYGSASITNSPENSYGALYALGGDTGSGALSTQIFVGINHAATSGRTRDMYFRSSNNLGYENAWRKVWDSTNLTNLNQLTNGPGYITSYTETDTLASVTGRGATTSTRSTFVEIGVTRAGSDTIGDGPWFRWTNVAETRQMLTQLNASNGLTWWGFNGSDWIKRMSLDQGTDTMLTLSSVGNNPRIKFEQAGVINRGATSHEMYIGEDVDTGGFNIRGSGLVSIGGDIHMALSRKIRVQNPSMMIDGLTPSYFGYSTGYGVLIVGHTGNNNRTLSFGVDVSGNPSGSFTGHGNEYLWRPAASFITPNPSNNGYYTLLSWNSSAQMTFNNAATFNSTIYAASLVYSGSDRNYFGRGFIRLTNETNNANVLDINVGTSNTTINGNYYGGGSDNSITIGTYAYNANQLRLNTNGRVGVRTTGPDYTFHVGGYMYNEGGLVNGDNTMDKDLGSKSFPDGVSNQAVDILFGDIALGGFVEVTISGTYSYASAAGGITKCFGILTNPGGSIYTNETFVRESLGTIRGHFAIGDFQWSASKGYFIPISHIHSSGNPVYVRIRCFSNQGKARAMFDSSSLGNIYTLTALGTNNVYFINNTGFGGKINPSYAIHSAGTIYSDADVVAYSDMRVKENIRPIDNVIDRITNSRGVVYDRIDIESKNNIGFIAQELETTFPELVETTEDGLKGVKYQNAVAVLFEAVKMQQKQIEELKNLVNAIAK